MYFKVEQGLKTLFVTNIFVFSEIILNEWPSKAMAVETSHPLPQYPSDLEAMLLQLQQLYWEKSLLAAEYTICKPVTPWTVEITNLCFIPRMDGWDDLSY